MFQWFSQNEMVNTSTMNGLGFFHTTLNMERRRHEVETSPATASSPFPGLIALTVLKEREPTQKPLIRTFTLSFYTTLSLSLLDSHLFFLAYVWTTFYSQHTSQLMNNPKEHTKSIYHILEYLRVIPPEKI